MKRLLLCVLLCLPLIGCSAAATKVEAKKSGPTIEKRKVDKPAAKKRIIIRPCSVGACEVPNG